MTLRDALAAAAHRAGDAHSGLIFWDDVLADPEVVAALTEIHEGREGSAPATDGTPRAMGKSIVSGVFTPPDSTEHEPCCACCSEVDRLNMNIERNDRSGTVTIPVGGYWDGYRAALVIEVAAESARLAEAVRGLTYAHSTDDCVDRAAVLALLEGER